VTRGKGQKKKPKTKNLFGKRKRKLKRRRVAEVPEKKSPSSECESCSDPSYKPKLRPSKKNSAPGRPGEKNSDPGPELGQNGGISPENERATHGEGLTIKGEKKVTKTPGRLNSPMNLKRVCQTKNPPAQKDKRYKRDWGYGGKKAIIEENSSGIAGSLSHLRRRGERPETCSALGKRKQEERQKGEIQRRKGEARRKMRPAGVRDISLEVALLITCLSFARGKKNRGSSSEGKKWLEG